MKARFGITTARAPRARASQSAALWATGILSVVVAAACGGGPAATGSGGAGGVGASGGSSGGGTGGSPGSGGTGTGTGGMVVTGSGGAGGAVVIGPPLTPGDPGSTDVKLTIRTDQGVHPISPLVYGTNQPQNATQNRYTVLRSGGNRMTAYNWENNASNAGSDYMFQNDSFLSDSNTPGAAVKGMLDDARAIGAASILTIPIVDYVAADKNGGGDVRNSGGNYLSTRFKQNRATKGAALSATPDASDAYVNQDEFVSWVKTTGAQGGQTVLFSLDNEPDLWAYTHAEVHPDEVGYDELCTRNVMFAQAVKSVWPTAQVTGFVSYGWLGYVNLQNAPDANGKGEFVDYYLDKMKAAEASAGHRLIDYLDLHWYPEAQGGGVRITGTETSSAVVAARLQAPRSLWDSSYKESSWVQDNVSGGIRLIPRMKEKIAARYAGTQLAFTEWNYGAGGHISGALADADVLGIFGREGVGLATYWALASDESFANAAFRAYRNFDGQNGAFGDTSISATTSDVANATVYASLDAANPDRVVIVAINKASSSTTAGITLAHPTAFTMLKSYTLTASGGAKLVAGASVTATAQNAFVYTMPAQSVSVLTPVP